MPRGKGYSYKEDMANTFRIAKIMQNFLQHQKIEVDEKEVELEVEEKEVICIWTKCWNSATAIP